MRIKPMIGIMAVFLLPIACSTPPPPQPSNPTEPSLPPKSNTVVIFDKELSKQIEITEQTLHLHPKNLILAITQIKNLTPYLIPIHLQTFFIDDQGIIIDYSALFSTTLNLQSSYTYTAPSTYPNARYFIVHINSKHFANTEENASSLLKRPFWNLLPP